MRYLIFGLIVVLAISIIGVGVWAAEKESIKAPAKAKEVEKVAAKAEKTIDNAWTSLKQARESFLKKDAKTAGTEIRKAAAFIKTESTTAAAKGKDGLVASANELEKLATDVEKGTVTNVSKLDDAVTKAGHAMANNHYLKAAEYDTKKDTKMAGQELKSATESLENTLTWTGGKMEKASDDAIKGARTAAWKIAQGISVTKEESGKAMKGVAREIEKLGKKAMPASKKETEKPEAEKAKTPPKTGR